MNRYEFVQHLQGLDVAAAKIKLKKEKLRSMEDRRSEIVNYHIKHNPLYRSKIYSWNGVFEDLPILRKSDYQKALKEIISDEYTVEDLYIGNTSGSSGHPFFYAKNKESHAIVHAIIERLYLEHGVSICEKQARFYGIPSSGFSRLVEIAKDVLLNRERFPVFDLSDFAMDHFLHRFKKKRFVYVYGYTSAIVLFAKYLKKRNLVLKSVCPTLKLCIVTSEVCTKEDRMIIEQAFGTAVVNEYGCSEAGMIAFEDPQGVWRLIEDDSYFEIVDSNGNVLPEGQEGRILITNFSNKALPFIRYEVGDLGVISHDQNGRFLQRLSGRVSDIIKLPSGKIAGGLTFYYISRSIMEDSAFIKEFIVRQTKLDTFVFDIVTDQQITSKVEANLLKKMEEYLEPGLKIKLNVVDSINRPKSGKIKHFYSEV